MKKQTLEKSDLENLKKEVVRRMVERTIEKENSKYGKFIIQTNEVQLCLVSLIHLRSFYPVESLEEQLERLELGNLITCFRICVKNIPELALVDSLKSYKDKRNKLAHKMFTDKKLTTKECESAIELGNKLIDELKKLVMGEIKRIRKQ
ncbi:MAG: hypothetical protein WC735_04620 [Candidatus Paceibacterota bacterium]|jgi:hypothetical protein